MKEIFGKYRKAVFIALAGVLSVLMLQIAWTHIAPVTISQKAQKVKVNLSDYKADELYIGKMPKFRSNAKFKILEIVPYRGMAEMGYAIEGEEPVDISKISYSDWKNIMFQIVHTEDGVFKWAGDEKDGHLVNQNTMIKTTLKEALQLSNSEVKSYIENHLVDVLVVEPSQINAHPELIDQSDYITVHDDFAKGDNQYFNRFLYFYETYSYEALSGNLGKNYYNSGNYPRLVEGTSTDLSSEVIQKLFYYGLVDQMPLSIPGHIVKHESTKSHSNLQKLGYALSVSAYLQYAKIKSVEDCYHDLFLTPHADTWEFWTTKSLVAYLCPAMSSNEQDKLVADIQNGYSDAVDNEFVGNYYDTTVCAFAHGSGNECSFLSKLGNPDSYGDKITITEDETWCKDVGNNTRDISICIYNGLRPTMKVLDIEPDNKFELTTLDVKAWIPDDVKIKVEVTPMTMSHFVGIVNDLNSDYDMIHFGKNVDRMVGSKIYYKGIAAKSESLYGLQGTATTGSNYLYSGNDITERMVEKVEAFISAGFPVAYDPDLVDASKVNTNTNIYHFLKANQSNMYQVKDGKHLSGGTAIGFVNKAHLALNKPKIYYTLSSSAEEYAEDSSSSAGAGGLNGLEFNTKFGKGTYRAYLYIDGDHNGVFNQWEKKNGSYSLNTNYEQPVWQTEFTSGSKVTVSGATIPQDAMLGTVAYKLEIVKLNGGAVTGVRSNVTGNIKVTHGVKKIEVLQLSDLTSYPEMDLTGSSTAKQEFMKYAHKSTVTDRFDIHMDSMDITKADFDELNLSQYDVIFIGFLNPDKKLNNAEALLNKVAIAAAKGKGIIFSQDALSYYNDTADENHYGANTNYVVRRFLGMDRFQAFSSGAASAEDEKMGFTYSVLNHFSENKYFSGLDQDIQYTDQLDRINEAKIERYPYVIGTDPTGFHAKSGIYQVDVEQKDAEALNGVSYFCLGGKTGGSNYTVSPLDVRNNYYLWRNDSVFYSGISKDSFNGSCTKEVKLFVNTIISAYGLERSVNITVNNLYEISDFALGKSYILYADLDRKATDGEIISGHKAVEFDLSITGLRNPTIKISFYQADQDGNKQSGPLELYQNGNKFSRNGSGSKKTEFTVTTDTDYVYDYPYQYLLNGANENIVIEATATEGGKQATDLVLIKALRRSMFDLD